MQNISRITRSQAIFMQQFFLIKINTFLLNNNASTYKNAITFFIYFYYIVGGYIYIGSLMSV